MQHLPLRCVVEVYVTKAEHGNTQVPVPQSLTPVGTQNLFSKAVNLFSDLKNYSSFPSVPLTGRPNQWSTRYIAVDILPSMST